MNIVINHYKLKNYIYLSILYVHMHAHMFVLGNMCGGCKKQHAVIGSLFPSQCGAKGSNSGNQAWQEAL